MIWLAAALLISGQAPDAVPGAPDPISLFHSACMTGRIQLEPTSVKAVTFDALPKAALAAIGHAIYRGPGAPSYPAVPLRRDIPNPIFRINGKDVFLITTTPEPVSSARFADSCMVIWRGDGFTPAHDLILPNIPDRSQSAHQIGIDYVSANDGQQVFTASLLNNWTVLKAAPAAMEPSAPVSPPGAHKN